MRARWFVFLLCPWLAAVARAEPSTPINFWAVTGTIDDVRMYDRLARQFERESGIRVKTTPLAWGNFATKYFASMAAGLPPDIGVTNLGGPIDYGSVGGLVDFRERFPDKSRALEQRVLDGLLPQFTFRGKLFGIPTELTTLLVYYRTDIFEKLGLKPAQTWSELEVLLRKLEANGYHYYFGWTQRAQWALPLYTMPFGLVGLSRSADGAVRVNWNDIEYQRGVQFALKLWHFHDTAGTDLGGRINGLFASNQPNEAVPMFFELPNFASTLPISHPELNGKWAIAPWPKADEGRAYNVIGGTAYVLFRKSKRQEEAFRWLEFLCRKDVQQQMILDRLQRGDASSLLISPMKEIWAPESTAFWNRPELRSVAALRQTLTSVVHTFDTREPILGTVEAGRIETGVLDRMATFLSDQLADAAGRLNLSKWSLIREIGQGRRPDVARELDAKLASRLQQEYASSTTSAQAIVDREASRYEQRYGAVIQNLGEFERRTDVLTWAKWVALLALAGAVCAVFGFRKLRKHRVSYAYISVPIVLSVLFVLVPAAVALYLSFTEYHPVLPLSSAQWVGSENYSEVLHSGDLFKCLWRTGTYVLWALPTSVMISLGLAALLNKQLRGQRAWRFLFFAPLVTSVVSISLIFAQLFLGSSQGWLNSLLLGMGAVRDPVDFLHSERTFLMCVIVLAIWHGLAFNILVFLAGLQQVPRELYEAAEVDGATSRRKFWCISVPSLKPQIAFISILGLIGGFQVFEPIYILGGGAGEAGAKFGPNDSGMTMVPLIYHRGFETFEMGRSAAIAYVLFVVILLFTFIQLRVFRSREDAA